MKLRNMTSIYILREDCLLLLYRVGSRVVEPSWCGVGGHFEPEELNRPDLCILRELEEETGITPQDITPPELRYITLRLKNGEVRQNYYFFAQLNRADRTLPACNEGELKWVPINQAMHLPCPLLQSKCLPITSKPGGTAARCMRAAQNRMGSAFCSSPNFNPFGMEGFSWRKLH